MLAEFEEKVLGFIREEGLFADVGKVLVGVSGGPDSVALLHILWALKAERQLDAGLVCAHLNHGLRGAESDGDERFVVSQAADLGIDILTERVDVRRYSAAHKLSIETAARKWRIETMHRLAKRSGCDCVATGHHKNDNAETVIQRFLRGTGYRGLAGIRPKHRFASGAYFIRPLLCVTREEIESYLTRRGTGWREDSSNKSLAFRRNFIRHLLIKEIQKSCDEPVAELLWDLSKRCRRLDDYLREFTGSLWELLVRVSGGKVSIDLPAFNQQHPLVKVELIRRGMLELGGGEGDLTEEHYSRALELAGANVSNRVLELPNGFRLWREYKKLILASPEYSQKNISRDGRKEVQLQIPGRTQFGNFIIETEVKRYDKEEFEKFKAEKDEYREWFDYGELRLPLTVRFRRRGDRFVPLGMKGEKKAAELLTDEQVPHDKRKEVLILSDAEKIIWICPVRMSECVKVTRGTDKILQIRIGRR